MTAVTVSAPPTTGPGLRGPVPARTTGPADADRSPATVRPGRTMRSWPPQLRPRCGPGGSASRRRPGSGWSPRCPEYGPPCTWTPASPSPSASRPTPAYALRAWLASEHAISPQTRRFAKWSAIFSFTLAMAGQIAYHLLAQAGTARAPWPITTVVSCLPVLVMETALAHMLHADATDRAPDNPVGGPATPRLPRTGPGQAQTSPLAARRGPPDQTRGPHSNGWNTPALSAARLPLRASQCHDVPCAATESRAPTRHSTPWHVRSVSN
jgi:hypothetical protein